MPQARRSSSTTRSRANFKQPPALKRLSTSLDTAQRALSELSRGSSREAGKGAKELYSDLRTFVSNARRDSNKLAKALQREFDQAQKQLSKAASASGSTGRRSTSSRSTSRRATSSSRSSSPRSTSSGSSSSRSSSGRSTSKRGSSGRSSTTSRRRTSKS